MICHSTVKSSEHLNVFSVWTADSFLRTLKVRSGMDGLKAGQAGVATSQQESDVEEGSRESEAGLLRTSSECH